MYSARPTHADRVRPTGDTTSTANRFEGRTLFGTHHFVIARGTDRPGVGVPSAPLGRRLPHHPSATGDGRLH
ncbi:MAG: hypothetical protein ABEH61_00635 [Haloarculaceae archaeon]